MLLCCLPFTAFAEEELHGSFTGSNQMVSGMQYVIRAGETVTVPAGMTVYLPSNATLRIEKGGTLKLLDSFVILNNGTLMCDGVIDGSDNIELRDNAVAMVKFRFPSLNDESVNLGDRITVNYAFEEGGLTTVVDTSSDELERYIPLNAVVRICAHIIEPNADRDKFDDSLLKVKFNNVPLSYKPGYYYKTDQPAAIKTQPDTGYFYTTATTGGDISFGKWTNDSDFLTTKRIVLPSGEGYECVSRYPVNKTEDGAIVVKYGDPFSFKVELDEAYDMSSVQVYIFNGYGWLNLVDEDNSSPTQIYAKADDYGYYNIGEVNTDLTITVTGVMKNSTINLIGNLLDTFRNIINMLKEFFEGMKDLFSGG